MAGGKETPRQKMISMMYLVLTAMLALNVSVEVLDAFHIVNEGIENVNTSVGKKIDDYYLTFEQQYDKQPEKAEPYWNAAQEIRTKTDEIINFIEKEIKLQLLLRNQDVTEEQLLNPEEGEAPVILNADEVKNASDRRTYYKVNLAAELNQRDKYDIPTAFMINDKNAERLREKVDEYRQFVIDAVESTGINNFDSHVGLRTDQKYYKDGSELTWEQHNFDLVILPAVISILNELVGEIQTTEYDAIAELFKNIGASDYKFNTLTAKVFPKSTYVLSGQDYEADVFIVASDDTREFDAKYIRGAKHFNANSNAIQTASSKSGVLKLKFPTKQEGEQFYSGVIEMINPETGELLVEKEGKDYYLRIIIDKPDGIDINDCEKVNDAINDKLDEADYIKDQYFLEVSSPGLERTLRKEKHFLAQIGNNIIVKLFKAIDKQKEIQGTLKAYNENGIVLVIDEKEINIENSNIALAKTVFEW